MTIIGILWIPVVQNVQGGQLFIYIQAVSAYFSPPIACLYIISILWTKATEKVLQASEYIQFKIVCQGILGKQLVKHIKRVLSEKTSHEGLQM